MHELIDVSELLKEFYSIVLKYSEVNTEYRTISKNFGTIPQIIAHEYNSACLKFATVPKIYVQTKHIYIPYHFFQTSIEQLEIKVLSVSTYNQLVDQFTKVLPEQRFRHDYFLLWNGRGYKMLLLLFTGHHSMQFDLITRWRSSNLSQ